MRDSDKTKGQLITELRAEIAERKQAEKELRRLSERESKATREWQELFDASTDIIALISPDFEILRINRAGYEGIGKKREELIGKNCYQVVHGLHHPIDGCPCQETLRTKKAGVGEITQGGRHYIATASPVLDKNGELVAFAHTVKDITERKRAEEELMDSEERYRSLINLGGTVGEAIVMLQDTEQGDAIHTFVSREWPRITGYSKKELLGMSFFDLVHPRYRQASLKRHRKKMTGETVSKLFEMPIIRKDGAEVPIELTSAYSTYKGERANVAFIRDITERKKMEKRLSKLYEAEKRERKELEEEKRVRGRSINVLAHELRTPLTPLVASATLLKDILPSGKERPERELVELIISGAETLAARLDELLDLARYAVGAFTINPQPLDIQAVLKKAAAQHRELVKEKKQSIILDLPQRLPSVSGDRLRLEQVLTNLLSNATKFSPEGGSITIRARAKGSKVMIEVEDRGDGLLPEEQERIFQPYHRVEQDRQRFAGLGLGLAICKQIVEAHGGGNMGRKSGGPRQQIQLHTARHKARGNKVSHLEI